MASLSDHQSLSGVGLTEGLTGNGQLLVINSADRVNAETTTPGRYHIKIQPSFPGEVYAAKLKSFTGFVTPYNVPRLCLYRITQSIVTGSQTDYFNFTFSFQPGNYSLEDILTIINNQPFIRFTHNLTTQRVTAERTYVPESGAGIAGTLTGYDITTSTPRAPPAADQLIGRLIGFPSGVTLNVGVNGVQTFYPVDPFPTAGSLIIGFDEIPTAFLTTGQKGGGFHIPLTTSTFDRATRKVVYQEGNEYAQTIRIPNRGLDRLGIRILDANTGSPFYYVGEHIMVIELLHRLAK